MPDSEAAPLADTGEVTLTSLERFTKQPTLARAVQDLAIRAVEGYPVRATELQDFPRNLSIEDVAAFATAAHVTVGEVLDRPNPNPHSERIRQKVVEQRLKEVERASVARLGEVAALRGDTVTALSAEEFLAAHSPHRLKSVGQKLGHIIHKFIK